MRVFFGLMRLERGRMHSTSKVLLFPRIEELLAASSARASAGASQVRVPELMNRWNDHVLVRRSGKASLQCAWCKLQAKLATSSGRPSLRIRESRLVCSHCTRARNADDKRGIADFFLVQSPELVVHGGRRNMLLPVSPTLLWLNARCLWCCSCRCRG